MPFTCFFLSNEACAILTDFLDGICPVSTEARALQSLSLPLDFPFLFQPIWEKDTDALLQSILTGSSSATGEVGGHLDGPFSDTSSDSGVNLEQQLLSPSSMTLGMEDPMAAASPKMAEAGNADVVGVNGINNLIDFISQGVLRFQTGF